MVVLLSLLVFQVHWLLTSAQLKEDQFRHRVTLALCSAVEQLGKDKKVCSAVASCSVKQGGGLVEFVGVQNGGEIKGTINEQLQHYQIDIPFDVTLSKAKTKLGYVQAKMPNTKNASIHIDFPSKQDFIRSELNGMFVTSFLLIATLIVICSVTLQWMFRQRKIQMDTVDYIDAMSHELKTPVNNISLALTMLGKKLNDDDERVSHYLSVAKEENQSLQSKINAVLGTAELERILDNQTQEICDLHDLIESTIQRLSVKMEERAAIITTSLQAQKSEIIGDRNELINVLICLLDNALTYVENRPEVQLETTHTDQWIKLRVSDNGVGIPKELHGQVFEKYFRKESAPSGYGVGLFVVKKTIQQYGGTIGLESQPGEGSTFTIELPLAP
ncbi:sensor histidine kinase [Reichenbachiella sp.]|uniref:sensor histidine kinase n=1 Tax=Reichenbachiella sp. TaxID=2184521 RepID=UPI003BB0E889